MSAVPARASRPTVLVKVMVVTMVVAGVVVLQITMDVLSYFTPERIQGWLATAGPAAPLLYMLVMALAVVISPIPSLPLDIAAGAFFGPLLGTLYSVVGALAGAVASFLIARWLGRDVVSRLL